MSNITTTEVNYLKSEYKTHALIAYVLMAVGLFTAIPIIVGAVWAMFKKSGSLGTIYHSHLVNATRVFWWALFWWIIGFVLAFVVIGYLVWAAVWIWALYRIVDGIAKLTSDQPYPLV